MTSAELLETFTKNNELYFQKISFEERDPPPYFDQESFLFLEDLKVIYLEEIIGDINKIYFKQKELLEQDLSFYLDTKLKTRFCFSEIKILKREYEAQHFNVLLSLDDFHNQLFEMEILESLVFNLITVKDELHELYEEEPKLHVNLEKARAIISNELYELRELVEILIRLQLIHCEIENNLEITPIEHSTSIRKEKSDLSLNQKAHLMDVLISSSNWGSLTQTRQAEYISLITGHNKDNARKALRKLNKKPSERSDQEQEDFEKIQNLTQDLDFDFSLT